MIYNLQFFGGRGASFNPNRKEGGGKLPARGKDLWSLRHTQTKEVFVDRVNKAIKNMMNQYKGVEGFLQDAWITKNEVDFYGAMTWGGELMLNKEFTDSEALEKAVKEDIKDKYRPPMGNKTAEESVVSHEMGHAIVNLIVRKTGFKELPPQLSERIVSEARAKTKARNNTTFGGKISKYARENEQETIAEAVSDVYCNGSKAKAESKAVVRVLKKELRKANKTK